MDSWHPDTNLYFVTTTAIRRARLFHSDALKRLIVDHLDNARTRQHFRLYTFVVMPNHIHLIVGRHTDTSLADAMRDLKKQTADRIVRHHRAASVGGFSKTAIFLPQKIGFSRNNEFSTPLEAVHGHIIGTARS